MKTNRIPRARRAGDRHVLLALGAAALVLAACNPVQVRTETAPGADLRSRPTFHLLRPRMRRDMQLSSNDPMLVNSITYRRIRGEISHALEQRGYQYSEDNAAMDVAYYATSQRRLDVRTWDYGYGWRRFWPRQRTEVDEYQEGTVIIDVVDPATHELLWRGQGRSQVSDDPERYASQLENTVDKIIAKFPERSGR